MSAWENKMNDKVHMAALSCPGLSDLNTLFYPGNIAVIGASTTFGKWGQVIFSNIKAGGFKGNVFPVNPKGGKMFGLKVFPSITDIPGCRGPGIYHHAGQNDSGAAGRVGRKRC